MTLYKERLVLAYTTIRFPFRPGEPDQFTYFEGLFINVGNSIKRIEGDGKILLMWCGLEKKEMLY